MKNFFNSINIKTLLIVSVTFLLSFLLIFGSFWFKGSMKRVYHLIEHANEVEITLRDILFKLKDCELDMRTYVLTNEAAYYNSFTANQAYVSNKAEDLELFVVDSAQLLRSIELENLLEARFEILESMTLFSDSLNIQEFEEIIILGEKMTGRTEEHVASMVAHEKNVLAEYERRLFSLMETRQRVSILGALFAMTLAIAIFILIRQESTMTRRRQELLQELNNNKDKFFSIISHDLKNPYTAIKGYIEMLNHAEYRESKEDLDALTKRLKSSSDRFDMLLNDLLTWARLQMNTVNVKKERLNLSRLVNELSILHKPLLESKNLTLELHTNKPVYGVADKEMTNTILRNLIGNAVKFTEQGNISISTYKQDRESIIEVTDSGTGMEEDVLKNLFKIGKVQSTKGTRNESGTGMGLILCKDMAERQGGNLSVTSTYGKGTSVKLYLSSAEPFPFPANSQKKVPTGSQGVHN